VSRQLPGSVYREQHELQRKRGAQSIEPWAAKGLAGEAHVQRFFSAAPSAARSSFIFQLLAKFNRFLLDRGDLQHVHRKEPATYN
jgi:hypothetical protein